MKVSYRSILPLEELTHSLYDHGPAHFSPTTPSPQDAAAHREGTPKIPGRMITSRVALGLSILGSLTSSRASLYRSSTVADVESKSINFEIDRRRSHLYHTGARRSRSALPNPTCSL